MNEGIVEITSQPTSLMAAIAAGLVIGLERERRKSLRFGVGRVPGGLRTFLLVALTGCVSVQVGGALVLASVSLAIGLIVVAGYWRDSDSDPGISSEIALLLTLILGGLAATRPGLAVGVAVIAAVALAAREFVHDFVRCSQPQR